ncbi:MAG: DNA mismatch repair endonuclease MutL [Deltaproteobacteria bacterium]|nr:DNA mismatch repair endonuclease MutL [Deltaproteobacteria bacterium]
MPKIRILPENLSNKIAAGEVVERPASAVKELLENAIDAESTKIVIEIEAGGRKLIRVSDNGIGMSHDDALLSLERYATSKISRDEDLFAIETLGFRGEAIPSIASVTRMEMVTRTNENDAATRIVISGGRIKQVSEIGAPVGTMIAVRDLFFNIPARRKFLKTVPTEMGHITDCVTRTALVYPNIHFKLINNHKVIGDWTATPDISHRVIDILGRDLWGKMCEIDYESDNIQVRGFAAAPDASRTTKRGLYVYVNGRFVRDRVIDHAVMEAYRGRLMKGIFPVAVIFVTLPPETVDVNVHPTKSAVRFAAQKQVHDEVVIGISSALKSLDRPGAIKHSAPSTSVLERVVEPLPSYSRTASLFDQSIHKIIAPSSIAVVKEPEPEPYAGPDNESAEAPLLQEKGFSTLRLVGQIHNSYIVCESRQGFIIIDQHAAHERILFEKIRSSYGRSNTASQRLLIPEPLELGYREFPVIEKLLANFSKMGIEIEPFGGRTYMIKSVPELLTGKSLAPLIMEIVETVIETGASKGVEKSLDTCFAVMACHGAIRANQALTVEEMEALLRQLDELNFPAHCPHGRPTWVEWTTRDIEKAFKRVL